MTVLRGCAALGLLAVLVVGVPWLLLTIGTVPAADDLRDTLTLLLRPGDGRLLLTLVSAVAWLAWLLFTVSVVVEVANSVRARPAERDPTRTDPTRPRGPIRLPGLGVPQAVAAGLVLAVVAMVTASPGTARADPPTSAPDPAGEDQPAASAPAVSDEDSRARPPADAPAGPRGVAEEHVHTVVTGDDLWTLAERYYGDGLAWRRIATANPDVLTGGPDELLVGWELVVPGVADPDGGPTVRVRPGDTLASLAAGAYGDPAAWPRIRDANPDLVTDPDHIEVGWQLRIPPVPDGAEPSEPEPETDPPDSDQPETDTPDTEVPEPGAEEPGADEPTPASSTPIPTTTPAPTGPPPGSTAPAEPTGRAEPSSTPVPAQLAPLAVPMGVAALGGLLAAGLITGLASRRELQLRSRPVGRRIVHPPPGSQAVEADLGRRAEPATLLSLDRALRAIDAHCRAEAAAVPAFTGVLVEESGLVFELARPAPPPPHFTAQGRRWHLPASGVAELPGESDAPRTTPALVCLGVDVRDRTVLVDLERLGVLRIEAPRPDLAESALAALAMELSFSYWSEQLRITLVGADPGLVGAVAQDHLRIAEDVDAVLDRIAVRAQRQRAEAAGRTPATHRLDPERAEAWASEVVLFDVELTDAQEDRLAALLLDEPPVAVAAVLGRPARSSTTRCTRLVVTDESRATLHPAEEPEAHPGPGEFRPQLVDGQVRRALQELVGTAASSDTTPAPWWDGAEVSRSEESVVHPATMVPSPGAAPDAPAFPTLLLIGPVELVGARGTPPSRAPRQCLEYCAWLLERPGSTAPMMAQGLAVAEGTRRSNMSRLRTWLGEDADGSPFLPDAYSGRISLHPQVSSDWQQVQVLVTGGVNRASTAALEVALGLVRGAPLADAAPGQWHWAEELRTDIASVVRDVGAELADRALADGDLDLARWAANRALSANPADEVLMCARIRTEHRAGRRDEVERLVRTVAAQARMLQVDLADETVDLMQQVLEGRPRRS